MTPREKAGWLIERFYFSLPNNGSFTGINNINRRWEEGKMCALIAVDEIISSAPFEPADTDWDEAGSSAQYWYPQKLEDSAKWWAEVKQEIVTYDKTK